MTSGQPLDDLYRFTQTEDRLELLEQTLQWRHLAPGAPDTLGNGRPWPGSSKGTNSWRAEGADRQLTLRGPARKDADFTGALPMADRDPFALAGDAAGCPHVYVVGNQPDFATRLVAGAPL